MRLRAKTKFSRKSKRCQISLKRLTKRRESSKRLPVSNRKVSTRRYTASMTLLISGQKDRRSTITSTLRSTTVESLRKLIFMSNSARSTSSQETLRVTQMSKAMDLSKSNRKTRPILRSKLTIH